MVAAAVHRRGAAAALAPCSAVIERNTFTFGAASAVASRSTCSTRSRWTGRRPTSLARCPTRALATPALRLTLPPRRGCSCSAATTRRALSDVHVLEVAGDEQGNMRWAKPQVLGRGTHLRQPSRRSSSTITRNRLGSLLVFAADMHDTFGTLYALRFRDGSRGDGSAGCRRTRWDARRSPVRAPSLSMLDEHVFVVCGVAAGKPLSTVAMLDTSTYTWSAPAIDGVPPPARMGATCTRVGTDLYIFGGSDGKSSLRDLNVLVYVTWFTPPYGGRRRPRALGTRSPLSAQGCISWAVQCTAERRMICSCSIRQRRCGRGLQCMEHHQTPSSAIRSSPSACK